MSSRGLLPLLKLQRSRIHAIAQSCRFGAIIENMPKVTAAATANNFFSFHAVANVFIYADSLCNNGLIEARPPRPRFKLGFRNKKLLPTASTYVLSFLVMIPILSGEGALSTFLPKYIELQWCQYGFPFCFRLFCVWIVGRLLGRCLATSHKTGNQYQEQRVSGGQFHGRQGLDS